MCDSLESDCVDFSCLGSTKKEIPNMDLAVLRLDSLGTDNTTVSQSQRSGFSCFGMKKTTTQNWLQHSPHRRNDEGRELGAVYWFQFYFRKESFVCFFHGVESVLGFEELVVVDSIDETIMGNSSSAVHDEEDPFDGADTLGYRVLGVQPNSPASKAGLVSFLDFLVGAEGKMLLGSGEGLEEGEEYDDVDLPALLKENVNKQIEFCE